MKEENKFQKALKKEIKERFPGCMVLKQDPNQCQGIPDLLVLYGHTWASLEVKKNAKAAINDDIKNQPYYIDKMNRMSFSSFIYPENKEEVINAMARSFEDHLTR